MRLLVITSCTGEKAVDHDRRLTLADFRHPSRLRERELELERWRTPAGQLYTGQQHVQLMSGVRRLRERYGPDAVTVQIVSAGYGLVAEDRLLAPYEATFNGMGRSEARAWARHLGIARDVRQALPGFPLVIFLLGSIYLSAVEPPVTPVAGQRVLFLAKPDEADRLARPGVTVVPAGKAEATRYGAGLIALKGRMFDLFARGLVREGQPLWDSVRRDDSPASFLRALAEEEGAR